MAKITDPARLDDESRELRVVVQTRTVRGQMDDGRLIRARSLAAASRAVCQWIEWKGYKMSECTGALVWDSKLAPVATIDYRGDVWELS